LGGTISAGGCTDGEGGASTEGAAESFFTRRGARARLDDFFATIDGEMVKRASGTPQAN
jgi:hypothetical protein